MPNFSEGRSPSVLAALAETIRAVAGIRLIDVSPDPDHHRSVYTFAGSPDAVLAASFNGAAVAVERIDLRPHRGAHPRIGAVDVIPFVPLQECAMATCVGLAHRLAARLAADLDLPVYLYGAAGADGTRTLAAIRRGGFERLRVEMSPTRRRPDYGPATVHPTAGAVAVGARGILIAFNVDLAKDDLPAAGAIASAVRASSGGLPAVQAIGVRLASRGLAQVSMNLLDYRQTPPLAALQAVETEAARLGIGVSAGELIGCAPRDALPPDPVAALRLRHLRPEQVLDVEQLARDLAAGRAPGAHPP